MCQKSRKFSGFFVVPEAAPGFPLPLESSDSAYSCRPTEGITFPPGSFKKLCTVGPDDKCNCDPGLDPDVLMTVAVMCLSLMIDF